jgi:hypothetical protein
MRIPEQQMTHAELMEMVSEGVIENYVFGFATPEEASRLKIQANIHPWLQTEIERVELSLEHLTFADAPLPPVHIKQQLMHKIYQESSFETIKPIGDDGHYNYAPTANNHITVDKAWKIVLFALLSIITLSLIAGIYFYIQSTSL